MFYFLRRFEKKSTKMKILKELRYKILSKRYTDDTTVMIKTEILYFKINQEIEKNKNNNS